MNGGAVLVVIGVWVLTQVTKGKALSRLGVVPGAAAPAAPADPGKVLPGSGIDPNTLKPLPLRSGGGGVW